MITIPPVQAHGFVRKMKSGRNSPCLFECLADNSELSYYVIKFSGILAPFQMVNETLALLMGQELGLPMPEPAIVDIDESLLTTISRHLPSGEFNSITKVGPHWGTKMASPAFLAPSPSLLVSQTATQVMLDIFAWDMLIENYDRRTDNPNLFARQGEFVIYDHELSFGYTFAISEPRLPWHLHRELFTQNHVFYSLKRDSMRTPPALHIPLRLRSTSSIINK